MLSFWYLLMLSNLPFFFLVHFSVILFSCFIVLLSFHLLFLSVRYQFIIYTLLQESNNFGNGLAVDVVSVTFSLYSLIYFPYPIFPFLRSFFNFYFTFFHSFFLSLGFLSTFVFLYFFVSLFLNIKYSFFLILDD